MAGANYTTLDDTSLYTPGQGTQIFVSPTPFDGSEAPAGVIPGIEALTLAAAVDVDDTTITVDTGCTKILYEGQPIVFVVSGVSKVVRVKTKTAANATTIPIYPAAVAIADASEADLESFIPFFSAKSANTDNQSQEYQDQAFNTLEIAKAVSGVMSSGQTSGPDIYGDPGKELMQDAIEAGKMLRVMILNAQGRGGRIANCRFSESEQRSNNAFNQYNVTLHVNGTWKKIPQNAA
jgi:hypothetical protein